MLDISIVFRGCLQVQWSLQQARTAVLHHLHLSLKLEDQIPARA